MRLADAIAERYFLRGDTPRRQQTVSARVIYDIRHVTSYSYAAPVATARCTLRLTPRGDAGQRVSRSAIELTPAPTRRRERLDFFGNRVVEARIDTAHTKLRITLEARVAVTAATPPASALTPAWETVRANAAASSRSARSRRRIFSFRAG